MTATSALLTAEQIAELRAMYVQRQNQVDTQRGLWAPVYETLYSYLTVDRYEVLGVDIDPRFDKPAPNVDPQTWLWLRGARFVNAGVGPFAALIRDYTIVQHRLRYGIDPSDERMDSASNAIAKNFLGQWLGFPVEDLPESQFNTQPDILQTGLYDAGPAAEKVFEGDPAGWAGTLLFGNLGDRSFWDNLVLQSLRDPNVVGSKPPLTDTKDRGSYNAVAAAAAVQEWAASVAVGNAFFTPGQWREYISILWAQSNYSATVNALADDTNGITVTVYLMVYGGLR
jgi:hypothetical protein